MSKEASSSGGSSGGGGDTVTVVSDVGRRRNTCGYCKSGRRTSISHGLWAHSLTISNYQDLLDRGWRRSGCFLYKPEMETTCCPAYTIRLKAEAFNPSKEQLRVSRRMQRYLDGIWDGKKQELVDKCDNTQGFACGSELPSSSQPTYLETKSDKRSKEEPLDYFSQQLDLATQSFVKNRNIPSGIQFPKSSVKEVSQTKRKRLVEGSEELVYTSNLSFQLAAVLGREKLNGNHVLPGSENHHLEVHGSSSNLSPKIVAEELAKALQHIVNIPHLSIKACNGHINFYSTAKESCPSGVDSSVSTPNGSSTLHESERHNVNTDSHNKKRKFEICLTRSHFDPEEYALYRRYQIQVHNDEPNDVSESSYRRFLVDTPLVYVPHAGDNSVPPCGFGSFHQQYRIDGRLVAVGVIDILPKCLSSKYLFWDPDFSFLSLGKYSALQEIGWVKENQHHCPSLQYYYLGYYIHSCSKMRYKAAYRPSELLCPLRYDWVPFDIAKPLLDRSQYAVLSDYGEALNEQSLLTEKPGKLSDLQNNDIVVGDSNGAYVDGDETMFDLDSGSSEDEEYTESNELSAVSTENGDVGNLLLGLRGTHLRYKDLRRVLGPGYGEYLEKQLLRYMKVVGPQLSEGMVYSVG